MKYSGYVKTYDIIITSKFNFGRPYVKNRITNRFVKVYVYRTRPRLCGVREGMV